MDVISPKIDRRKQRTRQFLRDALMELIVEKGYESISVQDITDRANVARPTFYLHYKDKDELLFTSTQEIYDDLLDRHPPFSCEDIVAALKNGDVMDDSDFQHIADHADFYRVMLSKKGSVSFIVVVLEYLTNLMQREAVERLKSPEHQPQIPEGFIASFLAGAEIGVANWWLKQSTPPSPRDVAMMMNFATTVLLNWSLKLDLEVPDYRPPN